MKGEKQPQGWTGPITTGTGGAPPESAQGQTPPGMHDGNQSSSPEEADKIGDLVADILVSNSSWTDREGIERALTLDDILIIAPL